MARIGLFLIAAGLLAMAPHTAFAAGDPVVGGKLFLQCRACHTVGATDRSGVGPNLSGVVGAKAGTKAGYLFSPAMSKSGLIWIPDKLDTFLTKPNGLVPGTKMAFPGVSNPKARADLIAYLATLKGPKR